MPSSPPTPSAPPSSLNTSSIANPNLPPAPSTTSSTLPPTTPPPTISVPTMNTSSAITTTPRPLAPPLTTNELPPPASLPLRPLFLTLLLACPLLAALPPRKMDLFTLMLGGAWVLSAEEVGRGMRYGWYMRSMRERMRGEEARARARGGEGGVDRVMEGGGVQEEGVGGIAEDRGVSDRIGAEVEGVFRETRRKEKGPSEEEG